jgi:outer membrane murein-binding lipoprotein Lpp
MRKTTSSNFKMRDSCRDLLVRTEIEVIASAPIRQSSARAASGTLMRFASAISQTLVAMMAIAVLLTGCGTPSAANIQLRKQNQTLADKIDQLNQQHARDVDTLAACQSSHPTTQSLAPDRLEQLVTTHGLTFGKLTGGDNTDSTKNVDSQLEVYVAPIDADGTPIKAAGAFRVDAFDLSDPAHPLVGSWRFDWPRARQLFYARFLSYTYVLPCPFQKQPAHGGLTVRVTFDDALTGREFVAQTEAKYRLATDGQ